MERVANQSDLTFYLVIAVSAVSLAALFLLDYSIHRRRPYVIKISEVKSEPSRSAPSIVTVSKPVPLPRLQPLAFTDVFRRSLKDYRANLILLVPPLVQLVQSQLYVALASRYRSPPNHFNLFFFLNGIVTIVMYFVVLFGEVSMTAAVISRGKTTLRDWPVALKYFWTVIGLGIIFGLLVGAPYIAALLLYQSSRLIYFLITVPLGAFDYSLLTVCLAAIALDNTNLVESLRMGRRVVVDRRSAFAGLFVFSTMVQLCYNGLYYLIGERFGASNVLALVSLAIGPLFLLVPFRIYWGFDRSHASTDTERSTVDAPVLGTKTRVCVQCGMELPFGSKFCTNCGAKQEY